MKKYNSIKFSYDDPDGNEDEGEVEGAARELNDEINLCLLHLRQMLYLSHELFVTLFIIHLHPKCFFLVACSMLQPHTKATCLYKYK